jgi:hypothetical protein
VSRPLEKRALPTGQKRRRGHGKPVVCSACRTVNWLADLSVAGYWCHDCGALQEMGEGPDPSKLFDEAIARFDREVLNV